MHIRCFHCCNTNVFEKIELARYCAFKLSISLETAQQNQKKKKLKCPFGVKYDPDTLHIIHSD